MGVVDSKIQGHENEKNFIRCGKLPTTVKLHTTLYAWEGRFSHHSESVWYNIS